MTAPTLAQRARDLAGRLRAAGDSFDRAEATMLDAFAGVTEAEWDDVVAPELDRAYDR